MNEPAAVRGRYIVLEGIDGSGKTTQRDLLLDRLLAAGLHAKTVREPAGDAVGRAIRKLLLDPQYHINARTEVLLFNAARAGLMEQINQLLTQGTWVVADRSFLTTIAYQGYGRQEGLALDDIRAICDFATHDTPIDLGLILDGDPTIFRDRRSKRGTSDRLDNLDDGFYARARQGYLAEANRRHLQVLDATGTPEHVAELIWAQVKPLTG